jgi:hypothetical protein
MARRRMTQGERASQRRNEEIRKLCNAQNYVESGKCDHLICSDEIAQANKPRAEQCSSTPESWRPVRPPSNGGLSLGDDGTRMRFPPCRTDPPPLKWSDLRYVFDIKEDRNGKEAIQA